MQPESHLIRAGFLYVGGAGLTLWVVFSLRLVMVDLMFVTQEEIGIDIEVK